MTIQMPEIEDRLVVDVDLDLAPTCDSQDCSDEAVWIVRWTESGRQTCFSNEQLFCEHHGEIVLRLFARNELLYCPAHGRAGFMHDLIAEVVPL